MGDSNGNGEKAAALVLTAVAEAEALIDDVMASAADRRSRDAMSRAIESYIAEHGEPRFLIHCYRCDNPVVDLPLAYRSARGLWTWMPPTYYLARFNENEQERRCADCDAQFPPVEPSGGAVH